MRAVYLRLYGLVWNIFARDTPLSDWLHEKACPPCTFCHGSGGPLPEDGAGYPCPHCNGTGKQC